MSTIRFLENYTANLISVIQTIPLGQVDLGIQELQKARLDGSRVFIIGNGGSAATAAHMVIDLTKNSVDVELRRIRVSSLSDNAPSVTAWANDVSYDSIFSEQLYSLAAEGDLVIAISTSGMSPNLLKAVETARFLGLTSMGLTGASGGDLKNLVDIHIPVSSQAPAQIEDAHHAIGHMMATAIGANLDSHGPGE